MRPDADSAFASLVLPHLDAAYNLARWLVRDPALADDVVQDSMLRAMTYFSSFRGDNVRAWLLRIVRNVAYDRMAERQSAERAQVPLEAEAEDEGPAMQIPDPSDGPEAVLARRQGIRQIEQALGALPPELRECIVLRELEELSYKEITRITGVPIGTVMSRLWRARRQLMQAHAAGAAG